MRTFHKQGRDYTAAPDQPSRMYRDAVWADDPKPRADWALRATLVVAALIVVWFVWQYSR